MTLAVPSSVISTNLRTHSSLLPSLNDCLLPLSGPWPSAGDPRPLMDGREPGRRPMIVPGWLLFLLSLISVFGRSFTVFGLAHDRLEVAYAIPGRPWFPDGSH